MLVAWALALPAVAVPEVPPLAARVNDLAGLLSRAEESALEATLAAFERETAHQIVVLTVPSLEGEAVESFALRVAETWGIGHEGLDNGAIMVVAAKDRRARIEVGYGLEGVIPDAVAARILRDRMIPRFREGAMGAGITDGAAALMAAARGEEIPAERRPSARGGGEDPLSLALMCGVAAGMFGGMLAGRRRWLGGGLGASLGGVAATVLLSSLAWGGAGALLGALIGAVAASGGGLSGGRIGRGRHGGYRGGFGRGGGGFGRGGGGFGGGGGGFGGGGASGGW